jgi:hypothetical protein
VETWSPVVFSQQLIVKVQSFSVLITYVTLWPRLALEAKSHCGFLDAVAYLPDEMCGRSLKVM